MSALVTHQFGRVPGAAGCLSSYSLEANASHLAARTSTRSVESLVTALHILLVLTAKTDRRVLDLLSTTSNMCSAVTRDSETG